MFQKKAGEACFFLKHLKRNVLPAAAEKPLQAKQAVLQLAGFGACITLAEFALCTIIQFAALYQSILSTSANLLIKLTSSQENSLFLNLGACCLTGLWSK
jgi:hypothetical protein